MASESMVLLREQCGRLLNKDEAKSVKVALETFSQNRVCVRECVWCVWWVVECVYMCS
eukprot:m.108315 g.108315  ORF g.108315 m.108315 type:complete len:58 (+) comp15863_c0_seq5:341-514(+)